MNRAIRTLVMFGAGAFAVGANAQVLDNFTTFNWRNLTSSGSGGQNFSLNTQNQGFVGTATGIGGNAGQFFQTGGDEAVSYRHRVGAGPDTVFTQTIGQERRSIYFRTTSSGSALSSEQWGLALGLDPGTSADDVRWFVLRATSATSFALSVNSQANGFGTSFASTTINQGINANQWYQLAFDWQGGNISASFRDWDGSLIGATGAVAFAPSSAFLNIRSRNDGGGFITYVDNVSAVPEPGTIAALGLGAAALLRKRRQKKSA